MDAVMKWKLGLFRQVCHMDDNQLIKTVILGILQMNSDIQKDPRDAVATR